MNKIFIFFAVLISLSAAAQNTASVSGNWDDCATWGNPTSIFNNTTDTKIINTAINVTQNIAWSANNVSFGTGNGSISFADNAKSIDFVTDAGNDKTCGPIISTLNCSGAVKTGNLKQNVAASGVSVLVPYTGGNGTPYVTASGISSAGVIGLTATLQAGNLTNGAGNLTFVISGTPTSSGTATFAVSFGGQNCSFTVGVANSTPLINDSCNSLTPAGGWVWNSMMENEACVMYFDGGNDKVGGIASKSFTGIAYTTYKVTIQNFYAGGLTSSYKTQIYDTAGNLLYTHNGTVGASASTPTITFNFTTLSTTTLKVVMTDTSSSTYNSDVGITLFRVDVL